jgi:hypothetical protein
MAIASGVAIAATSYLAIDAVVDVNADGIAKRIEMAQASIRSAVAAQYQQAFTLQARAHGGDQKHRSAAERLCSQGQEHGPRPVQIDRGV